MSRLPSSDEEEIPLVPHTTRRPPTPEFGLRSYHSALRSPHTSTRSLARSPKATRSSSTATFSQSSHSIHIVQVSRATQTFQHLKGRSVFSQTEEFVEEKFSSCDKETQTDIQDTSDHFSQTDVTVIEKSDQILQLNKELSAISQHLKVLQSETHYTKCATNQNHLIAKLNTIDQSISTDLNQIVAKLNANSQSISRLTKLRQQNNSVRFVDIEKNLNFNLKKQLKEFFKWSVSPLYIILTLLLIICIIILCLLLLQKI